MYEKNQLAIANREAIYKPKQLGFTLIEIMLALGAIAVLSTGSVIAYKSISERGKTAKSVADVRLLSDMVMQTWGTSGSFQDISSASIVAGKAVPEGMRVANGKIANAWGGPIDLAPTPDNTAYVMTLGNVPSGPCSNLTAQVAKGFLSASINGTPVYGPNQSLNVSEAAKLCGASSKNSIALTSTPVAQPDFGEVPLPAVSGAPVPAVLPPATKGATSVAAVSPVSVTAPSTRVLPTMIARPTVSQAVVGSVVTGTTTTSPTPPAVAPPPGVVLPPQTCFPSVVSTPVNTTLYQNQTLSCQSGYAGAVTQQQHATQTDTTTTTTTCEDAWAVPKVESKTDATVGIWSAWQTISNTCSAMCSTRLAGYAQKTNYNWVTVYESCPAGYTGTKSHQVLQVQTNTPYCPAPSGTADPIWTGWSSWSNTGSTQNYVDTCVPSTPPPPTPSVASSMWGVGVDVSPSPTATYYQMGLFCGIQGGSPVPVPATIQSVPNLGLPTSANMLDTFKPALVIGGMQAVKVGTAQLIAMTQALPQSSCQMGGGFGGMWPAQVQVRACNSTACSAWSTPVAQFCSWSRC